MTENRSFIVPSPGNSERNIELQRRAELRRNYLVPIYFMHTSNVPAREAQAAFLGVKDALLASGQKRELINFGSRQFGKGAYSSPDWYIEEAKRIQSLRRNVGFGPQIDVSEVSWLFTQEPYQEKPHWEVFVANNDLNSISRDGNYLNFVFGSTNISFPSSVQSITRILSSVSEGDLRDNMIRRLLRHETGHMFGLPSWNRKNTEEKLGIHCTNICTMRQGLSIQDWAKETRLELNNDVQFCGDCKADFAAALPKYKPFKV